MSSGYLNWWCQRILHDVTAALGVTEEEVLEQIAGRPRAPVAHARVVLCWLLHEITGASYVQIGALLQKHPDNVYANCRTLQREIDQREGHHLFSLQLVLTHARVSGPLLAASEMS